MKRMICVILVFCLSLSGCSALGERIKEPVTFYYIRESYSKDMEQVMVSEVREASGHRNDLPYLLVLYSMGPSTDDLKSPLPRNTAIILSERTEDHIQLSLSESAATVTDADLTLASACIAMTCMELTGVPQVTVTCADRSITIREDNLLLHGGIPQIPQEETK